MFQVRTFGTTLVSRTQGTKLATDGLKGRIYEVNLADLNNDDDQAFRKIKLQCEEVQGNNCLCDFAGMDMTRDKLCSLVRKWHTLIEATVDVKTQDGYFLRMFCIGFTQKRLNQVKATCYAQSSQVRKIRKKMVEIMSREAKNVPLRKLVEKFIPEAIGKEIEKSCKFIFPLQNVHIRKVKILKKPKLDLTKLMELHQGGDTQTSSKKVEERTENQNILSAQLNTAD